MRIYQTLGDAILEIRRDLYKSPRIRSERVQHLATSNSTMLEAMNYSYCIQGSGFPDEVSALVDLGAKYFPFWQQNADQLAGWLYAELRSRKFPYHHNPTDWGHPETKHPTLKDMVEGNHWSYTYRERLMGMGDVICENLEAYPETRRAFWPVFHPMDAIRAQELTRIPCTLGYQWALRPDPSGLQEGNFLECTMISRSVDYSKYWLSDIWFAYKLTQSLASSLSNCAGVGNISHFIVSFHRFLEEGEETF